jgi:hypothetical protein
LQTAKEIVFSNTVQSIPLGSVEIGGGVRVQVAGWGQTSHPGTLPDILQFTNKSTITNPDCRNRIPGQRGRFILAGTLCTFEAVGIGMCFGDSGQCFQRQFCRANKPIKIVNSAFQVDLWLQMVN